MDATMKKTAIALGGILAVAGTVGLTIKKTHSGMASMASTFVSGASFADIAGAISGTEASAARQEFVRDYMDFVNTIQATANRSMITFDFLPPGTKGGFHWVFPQHTTALTLRQVSVTETRRARTSTWQRAT